MTSSKSLLILTLFFIINNCILVYTCKYYRRLIVGQEMGCENGLGLQIAFELMR